MGFHLALGIFLRGVAEGEGVVAEDHRAARSEGLHVQAGIGTAPGIVGRQHGGRIHREGFVADSPGRVRCRSERQGEVPLPPLPPREKPPCSPGRRINIWIKLYSSEIYCG